MIIVIDDDGLRAIVEDGDEAPVVREAIGAPVGRASSIEPIATGPKEGWWTVDFSHLSVSTGDPKFACCLANTFARRADAIAAEVEWLKANFLGLPTAQE